MAYTVCNSWRFKHFYTSVYVVHFCDKGGKCTGNNHMYVQLL